MRKILKWLGIGTTALFGLTATGVAYVYFASQSEIDKLYDIPVSAYTLHSDSAAITRGQRLATLTGCANSCHGQHMEGAVLFNEPGVARINAPNLTRIVREYSDPELVRLLRHGVKQDGTTTWIMPSPMFAHLSEQDMNDIIAFIRSVPERDGVVREVNIQPLGRLGIVMGQFAPLVPQIDHDMPRIAMVDKGDPLIYGEYLVKTSCTECHGQDLQGSEFLKAPNLLIAEAYSEEAFAHLMRTGLGLGNRHLGLMTEVGETRFPSFTDEEVRAIRMFLHANATGGKVLAATHKDQNGPG